jgi:aldose 1-epimerase
MSIHQFGEIDGVQVQEIRLRTMAGAEASIVTWGAALRDLMVPLVGGRRRRVVLGFQDAEGYRVNPNYLGVTAGRNANRVAGGHFVLDGVDYQLALNEGERHHLHGGFKGFSRRPWRIVEHDAAAVTLAVVSEDGDQHYPGRVEAMCQYQLLEPATLRVTMTARSEEPTPVNMVHHSYFTVDEGHDCRQQTLWVNADFYTPTDADGIPTGEIRRVEGTPYDFRTPRPIISGGVNYDLNFVLRTSRHPIEPALRLTSPQGDLQLEVATNEIGLQFYTGFALTPTAPGIDGQQHGAHAGMCLEPQRFPDAVNQRHFPSSILRPGQLYRNVSEYRFTANA